MSASPSWQARLVADPEAVAQAIELANIYLDGHRPDWALATVGSVLPAHENDFRLHHLRAIAYADRFESAPAFEAASRALALCERTDPGATPVSAMPTEGDSPAEADAGERGRHRHARRPGAREGKDHAAPAPHLFAEAETRGEAGVQKP